MPPRAGRLDGGNWHEHPRWLSGECQGGATRRSDDSHQQEYDEQERRGHRFTPGPGSVPIPTRFPSLS